MSEALQLKDATPEGYQGNLNWMWWNGWRIPYNPNMGVTLNWLNHMKGRITKKLSTKVIVVGEAGISKTYSCITLARLFDARFNIDQLIFGHKDYLSLTLELATGRNIVLDEPSYVLGKREWYEELNQILVHSIESDRYAVHPLYIPIISKDLLDKTVREHLIQFLIIMYDRGKGNVYRLERDHFNDKVLYHYVCGIELYTAQRELATCNRDTCLGCSELQTCNKFIWPQYERKRASIQKQRYKEGIQRIEVKESRAQSTREIFNANKEDLSVFEDEKGNLSEAKISYLLGTSDWRSRKLRELFEEHKKQKGIASKQ